MKVTHSHSGSINASQSATVVFTCRSMTKRATSAKNATVTVWRVRMRRLNAQVVVPRVISHIYTMLRVWRCARTAWLLSMGSVCRVRHLVLHVTWVRERAHCARKHQLIISCLVVFAWKRVPPATALTKKRGSVWGAKPDVITAIPRTSPFATNARKGFPFSKVNVFHSVQTKWDPSIKSACLVALRTYPSFSSLSS